LLLCYQLVLPALALSCKQSKEDKQKGGASKKCEEEVHTTR